MADGNIVVVGASAGGVQALQEFVSHLPSDLNSPVLVVLHIPANASTHLDEVLHRAGPLPAKLAENGEAILGNMIYVAPNDFHLEVQNARVRLSSGPLENLARPSIDILFRSAAFEYGPRAIGVVLSGMLDDGTAGLSAIKDRGGTTIVQSAPDAAYKGMPQSAVQHVRVDHILPASAMGPLIRSIAR